MIRTQTKRIVRTLYLMRCGYCGVTEQQVGAELTYDHFQPRSANGSDDAANIVHACHACNEFKGDYWSDDPQQRLLHPLNDDLNQHLREEIEGTLTALTERGRVYRDRLQLNRPPLVGRRDEQQRLQQAIAEQRELQRILENILDRLESLEDVLQENFFRDDSAKIKPS